MLLVFVNARKDFDLILLISYSVFFLPMAILSKAIYSKMVGTTFIITVANMIDMVIVIMVLATLGVVSYYETRPIPMPLFGDAED